MEFFIGGYRVLLGNEYTTRHTTAAKVVKQALATAYTFMENPDPYYKYTPIFVLENTDRTGFNIHTDKTIPAYRLGIIFQFIKEKIIYLIDIVIPNDTNFQTKYTEKIYKYHRSSDRNKKGSGNKKRLSSYLSLCQ